MDRTDRQGFRRRICNRLAGSFCRLLTAVAATVAASIAGTASADPADVAAHLRAGEVPAALAAAAHAGTDEQRDAALMQIVVHQARRDRAAAARTMTDIASDKLRGKTAAALRGDFGIAAQLFGGPAAPGGGGNPFGGPGGFFGVPPAGGANPGGPGGAAGSGGSGMADFDPLIDMITSTIAPETWDLVGGPGAIDGFEGGVRVNPAGLMKPLDDPATDASLRTLWRAARTGPADAAATPRSTSGLRMVSLPRLEKHLQRRWALGQSPSEDMRALAGLTEIRYLFVYEKTGDIVIAGPAEDWTTDDYGRRVGTESGRPVLSLDDLAVLLRCSAEEDGRFGCSITPRKERLAETQEYLNQTAKRALRPGEHRSWVRRVREKMGEQDITVYGVPETSHTARVMVEADYHMKLVGLGIQPGVLEVEDYLTLLAKSGEEPSAVSVLRWWFTLKKDAVAATADRTAFAISGRAGGFRAQVQSENERLSAEGDRIHTGKADEINAEFARSFSTHYGELATKYPIYAELENIFDLAVAAAALREHGLADRAQWRMAHLLDDNRYTVAKYPPAKTVETVANAKVIGGIKVLLAVSGGVAAKPRLLVTADALAPDTGGNTAAQAQQVAPKEKLAWDAWWWD